MALVTGGEEACRRRHRFSVSCWLGESLELQLPEPSFRLRLEQPSKLLMPPGNGPRSNPDAEAYHIML